MNILVTLDANYIRQLIVMLKSLAVNNRCGITVYIISRDLTERHLELIRSKLHEPAVDFVLCPVKETGLRDAPVSGRYPMAIYDRLFAPEYLPDSVDRVLYLDPDLIVLKSLEKLWSISLGNNFYAAASHVGKIGDIYNSVRVEAGGIVPYFNSGVLLMNLKLLRKERDTSEIADYISMHSESLMLPDQDVLTALYGRRIFPLDPFVYNMTERLLNRAVLVPRSEVDAQWVFDHSAIVHYVGRNKPWNPHYRGKLGVLYKTYEKLVR